MRDILIFIPTYNELENVGPICEQLLALPIDADIHFVDDGSPDGTGAKLDELSARHQRVTVSHRPGKLGIGSAHQGGIQYAYEKGYRTLITMDCDFTHDPIDIPKLLAARAESGCQIVIGSRYLREGSLAGWTLFRRALTLFAHFLTENLLQMKYDASGAFRLYDLARIPHNLFRAVQSRSYSFFFESLFVLTNNGIRVKEIAISLPPRTYGHSKMSWREALRSAQFLLRLSLEKLANPGRFRLGRTPDVLQQDLQDPQNWAPYWSQKKEISGFLYELVAAFYRNLVIRPNLQCALRRNYQQGDALLHAGCGSGQVDTRLHDDFKITAIDISKEALDLYSRYNPGAARIEQQSIFQLPYPDGSFDGVYNLGVMEHFTHAEIVAALTELKRVLRPGKKMVLFWPYRHASSVLILKLARVLISKATHKTVTFHPAELSLVSSRAEMGALLAEAGLDMTGYRFGWRDFFVQAVIVAEKRP